MHLLGLVWRETGSNLQVLRLIVMFLSLHFGVVKLHLVTKGVKLALVYVAELVLVTTAIASPNFPAISRLYRVLSALIVDFVHLGSKPHLVMVLVILNFILISIGSILLSSSLMI